MDLAGNYWFHHNYNRRYDASWNNGSGAKSSWQESNYESNFDEGALNCDENTVFTSGGDSGYWTGGVIHNYVHSGTLNGTYVITDTMVHTPDPDHPERFYSATDVRTWTLPVDPFVELIDQGALELAAEEDWISGGSQSISVFSGFPVRATFTLSRFRWQIHIDWIGSYFKITWDILDEPDGWDDPSPVVSRSFFLTDQTWKWTGPGNPEDAEDDSWFSPWYEIPLPEVAGNRRIVNIRFECYTSARLGNKPQVMGEAISDDEL